MLITALIVLLDTSPDPVQWLISTGGALGVILALLIIGRLHTQSEVDTLKTQIADLKKDIERKDRIIDRKDEMIQMIQLQVNGQAIPALTQSTQVLQAIPDAESRLVAALQESQRELAQTQLQLRQALAALPGDQHG